MKLKRELIEAFFTWLNSDQHKEREDIYTGRINLEYLNNLSKENFLKFFFEFTHAGGMVQSGGERFAGQFIEIIKKDYDGFRSRILETFKPGFDLDKWLEWASSVQFFTPSTATIFLNRVNKNSFIIVNKKSIYGLQKLGFTIPSTNNIRAYKPIELAETALLRDNPELENYFKVDALMHFIVAEDEGKSFFNNGLDMDYFNLAGFRNYASAIGQPYDSQAESTKWYLDTRSKLEYLVSLLKLRLGENIGINYSERPNAQAGRGQPFKLKEYILTGFSPDSLYPRGELFIKMAFHTLSKNPIFDIEFDINNKLENKPFKELVDKIKETTRKRIPVDSNFPNDWESLLKTIQDNVKKMINDYRNIAGGISVPIVEEEHINLYGRNENKMDALNTIIYGPPGTGKTYRTVDYALSIIEGLPVKEITQKREKNEKTVKQRFDNYIKEGKIVFCTFHQSMGYEDFIEGIKPLPPVEGSPMQYDVIDGIFKKLNIEAIYNLASKAGSKRISESIDFSEKYDLFVESVQERWSNGETVELETKSGGKIMLADVSRNNYLIFNHPGSDRPVLVSKPRLAELSSEIENLSEVNNIDKHFRSIIGGMDSTAYWASLNALRNFRLQPVLNPTSDHDIKYDDKKSAILNFVLDANNYIPTDSDRFVLIIDEINRGNIAQIFGELITLIEEDKRKGGKNEIAVTLPYSGESFTVAPNLYIIGTMNTADRSVEALDTALRRRFSFVKMEPLSEKLIENLGGINLKLMLDAINDRLEILLDKDHTIGHAWLMNIQNLEGLRNKFGNKILPLLHEFFYNETEKIGLVLSENFFIDPKERKTELSKFKPGAEIAAEHKNKRILQLKPFNDLTKEDFISIYEIENSNKMN
jgi:5-methylcytosine-specific restriction endonuclease McrBC GTP-binding regulatory subunit McrB